ncbi:MAG: UDP-N-acetylmuramate--L-alanine ligase [Arcobacteraceae bacterium]
MNIHFIGIGGIGLSALARILKYDGHTVSGSDIKETPLTKELESEGITVTIPHNKSAISEHDLVIYSAAVKPCNEEIIEAAKRNIETLSRKEALRIVLFDKKNYCVAGAHGKSTTTAILASILQSTALIGAISKEFDSNFRYKNNTVCFEADESDASFLLSNPYCAIVTNAEPEHMEYYNHDLTKFYNAYKQFLHIAKVRVINAEDDFLSTLEEVEAIRLYPSKDIKNISFTLKKGEPYTAFELKDLGSFEVWGFGHHIALDASLAILAALNEIGLDEIKANLSKYKGIKKRFDIIQKTNGLVVIDDYAHHPTEIKATMKSVSLYSNLKNMNKTVVIWQPHKYSRTLDNLKEFKECFKGCDELVILPVYSAGESVIEIDFAKEFEKYNPTFAHKILSTNGKIELLDKDNLPIKSYIHGLIVGVGAGDITYQLRA